MGHAEFERRPAVAEDSVTVGLPRSHGCVSEDRGAGVAIDDFPSGGIGPPGLSCDGIEATQIAVAFPVALEGESDARGKRLPEIRSVSSASSGRCSPRTRLSGGPG